MFSALGVGVEKLIRLGVITNDYLNLLLFE
jgi:hypothetical protein